MRNRSLIFALLLLATALVYINSIDNPFVPDDRVIIFRSASSQHVLTLRGLFGRSLFSTPPSEPTLYFRPLTLLTFALNRSLAGESPQGYRTVNILIHLLVVALVAIFFSHLAGRWVAVFAALLFAVHPVHVEAVTYISSRSDPLYTALALLCLLFWHQGNQAQGMRRRLFLGSALSAFFLGLFAKETMVVVSALAVAMDLVWNRTGSWRRKFRENLGWYLGFLLLFSIYLLIRFGEGFPLTMEGGKELDLGSKFLWALKIFTAYLGLAFYPAHLSLFRVVPIPQSLFEWQVVLGTVLLAGMVILAWILRGVRKEISFGALWYLISLLPVLDPTLLNIPMMEHWLYLPLIGLTLAFVGGVKTLAEKVGEVRAAAFGLTLVALLLSAKTVTRNAEWGDPTRMLLQNVASYPRSAPAWAWLGDAMSRRGRLDDSIRAYSNSVAINPNMGGVWAVLGNALSVVGRDKEVEEALSRAISLRPREHLFPYHLGIHRLKVGRNRAAIEALEKSIGLDPSPSAYHVLGSAYLRLDQNGKAEQAFHKAMLMDPGNNRLHAGIHVHLGKLYLAQGKHQQAREEWQLALRFDPNHVEASRLLSQASNPRISSEKKQHHGTTDSHPNK